MRETLLAFMIGTVAGLPATVVALGRTDYIAMGMAGTAMVVSFASAAYVYIHVARARRQPARVSVVEAQTAEIDDRLRRPRR